MKASELRDKLNELIEECGDDDVVLMNPFGEVIDRDFEVFSGNINEDEWELMPGDYGEVEGEEPEDVTSYVIIQMTSLTDNG